MPSIHRTPGDNYIDCMTVALNALVVSVTRPIAQSLLVLLHLSIALAIAKRFTDGLPLNTVMKSLLFIAFDTRIHPSSSLKCLGRIETIKMQVQERIQTCSGSRSFKRCRKYDSSPVFNALPNAEVGSMKSDLKRSKSMISCHCESARNSVINAPRTPSLSSVFSSSSSSSSSRHSPEPSRISSKNASLEEIRIESQTANIHR